jgi:hypothetical protein
MESRVRRRVACTVRAGGLRKRTGGNISTAPQADPTAGLTARTALPVYGLSAYDRGRLMGKDGDNESPASKQHWREATTSLTYAERQEVGACAIRGRRRAAEESSLATMEAHQTDTGRSAAADRPA